MCSAPGRDLIRRCVSDSSEQQTRRKKTARCGESLFSRGPARWSLRDSAEGGAPRRLTNFQFDPPFGSWLHGRFRYSSASCQTDCATCHSEAGIARRRDLADADGPVRSITTCGLKRRGFSASPRVGCQIGRALFDVASHQSLTRSCANDKPFWHDKPVGEQRQVWSLARRARRGALGHRKRLAHPAQQSVRRRGDRLLGTRPDSPHLSASSRDASCARSQGSTRAPGDF